MNATKLIWILLLSANCGLASAQTNTPAKKAVEQELEIDSDSGIFDGITNRMVYMGHVIATDHVKATMTCERLTVDLPPNGGNPTNIVAETNVVVDMVDGKGQTNHITAARAVYSYRVAGMVTNEIVTFTGSNPIAKLVSAKGYVLAETMVFDIIKQTFGFPGPGHVEMHFKQPATGTNANAMPFKF